MACVDGEPRLTSLLVDCVSVDVIRCVLLPTEGVVVDSYSAFCLFAISFWFMLMLLSALWVVLRKSLSAVVLTSLLFSCLVIFR